MVASVSSKPVSIPQVSQQSTVTSPTEVRSSTSTPVDAGKAASELRNNLIGQDSFQAEGAKSPVDLGNGTDAKSQGLSKLVDDLIQKLQSGDTEGAKESLGKLLKALGLQGGDEAGGEGAGGPEAAGGAGGAGGGGGAQGAQGAGGGEGAGGAGGAEGAGGAGGADAAGGAEGAGGGEDAGGVDDLLKLLQQLAQQNPELLKKLLQNPEALKALAKNPEALKSLAQNPEALAGVGGAGGAGGAGGSPLAELSGISQFVPEVSAPSI